MDTNDEREVDRMIAERLSTVRSDGEWQPNLQRGLALLRKQRTTNNGRKRRWGLITAAAIAACLPIMAFPVTRAFAERWVSACVQESAAVRQFLLGNLANSNTSAPIPSSTYVMPADRRMAPDFILNDASGKPVKLSDSRGKVVLLNFWATNCTPCKQQIPWFIELRQNNMQRGFEVLGVSMDENGWTLVKPYMDKTRVNYPVLIGNDQVAGLFGGLHPMPLTLVIDRSGQIAAIHAGLCRKDEYEGDINAVLSER